MHCTKVVEEIWKLSTTGM